MAEQENDYKLFTNYDNDYVISYANTPCTITIYNGGTPPVELVRILPNGEVQVNGDLSVAAKAFWDAVALFGRNVMSENIELRKENVRLKSKQ